MKIWFQKQLCRHKIRTEEGKSESMRFDRPIMRMYTYGSKIVKTTDYKHIAFS